jgi:ribosomal protein S3AE
MAVAKRKKRFFDVDISSLKKTTQLQAYEIEELEGRILNYDLTRLLRGKNMLGQFIVHVSGGSAGAEPRALKLLPTFIRRMIRKGTHQVEDSFTAETKDSKVIIKPFMITRRKVARAIRTSLRSKAREELLAYAKEKTAAQIFDDILKNSVQKELSLKLKKIYPLSLCEIRIFSIKK